MALVVVACDQVTKALAVADLAGRPLHLLGPFALELEYNRGVAFSLGSSLGAPLVLVIIAALIAVVLLGGRAPGRAGAVAIGLIAGGALGNLGDRLFRPAGVVDFFRSGFWPTFNVADAAITVGCVLLALVVLRRRPQPPEAAS